MHTIVGGILERHISMYCMGRALQATALADTYIRALQVFTVCYHILVDARHMDGYTSKYIYIVYDSTKCTLFT